ncbi:mutS protein homolog 4 isoform X2 [Cryptotermes secundus]|uniref:mutS protein homolog 4 isoform X2 n=1 Tax=Cryptotermes secundus TaxID=105785 RepID=UPI001454DF73|nr:mutS protein homolog 4 isoform X2 [Cryptotermes secundus]
MNVFRGATLQNRGRSIGRGRGRSSRGAGLPLSQVVCGRVQNTVGGRFPVVTPKHFVPSHNAQAGSSVCNTSSAIARKQFSVFPSSSGSGSHPRTTSSEMRTPRSATNSTSDNNSMCIVALTEGRGQARGEVGIAALDINYPHLILCQIGDSQSYVNTLTKINILVPNTFCDRQVTSKLYTLVQEAFPTVTVTSVLRRHFRDTRGLQQIENLCANEYSSIQIVVSQKFYALAAAAALLKYIEFVRNVLFAPKSLKVEYQGSQNTMVIDVKTAHLLELTQSLRGSSTHYSLMGIMNHCQTRGGIRLLRSNILEPPRLLETILTRLDCVQEIVETPELHHALEALVPKFCDVDHLLALCMHMPRQDSKEVAEIQMKYTLLLKTVLEILPTLKVVLQDCKSKFLCNARECLADERYQLVHCKILSVLYDDARTAKGAEASQMQCNFAVKAGISGVLDLARRTYCEIVSDISALVAHLATEYNLPLKVNYNGSWGYHIQLSQSKRYIRESDLPPVFVQVHKNRSTLSFTTQELIQIDRRSKEAVKEIVMLSNVVICDLLADIRNDIGCLFKLCEVIAELDMLISFANLSSVSTYVRPHFGRILDVKQSRHPILDFVLQHEPVPNDVFASSYYNCHIITGPNMSGKSIYIRQIALLQIMAQIGCYVPAHSATFRISDHIFSRLSFDDSIECNASTFVLELKEFQFIKQMTTPLSLIIVDELCRGTSCEEGTAIAWVILEQLMDEDAFIFLTTHFLYLTKLQELYCNVTNHHFEALWECTELGRDRLVYTHKLLPGVTQVENYGLHLAQVLACPELILNNSKKLAQKLSSQRKAFGSSAKNNEMHNYYTLASTVIECVKCGMLSAQKLEELKHNFYINSGEADATEAQSEDGCTDQENGATELLDTLERVSQEMPASNSLVSLQHQENRRCCTPQEMVAQKVLEKHATEVETDITVQEEVTDEPLNKPDHTRHKTATKSRSAIFLQRQTEEEMFAKQGSQKLQANMNIMYNQTVTTEPEVYEFVQDDEPMEVEHTFSQEGIMHMSPIISLPEENNP